MSTNETLLRDMVREILRDLVAAPGSAASGALDEVGPAAEVVRIADQDDLDRALSQVLTADASTRAAISRGELRFEYAGAAGSPAGPAAAKAAVATAQRVERGAVTERIVNAAAQAGRSIEIARGVVITPLAKDRARALGVSIQQDRQE